LTDIFIRRELGAAHQPAHVSTTEKASNRVRIREVLKDPHGWWHEIFTALVVGVVVAAGSVLGQKMVDDSRATREDATIAAEFRHNEQAADLRFVREQPSPNQVRPRPFSKFDLEGQNLVGLLLQGADFAYANLKDAFLMRCDLSRADFTRTELPNANLSRTDLRGAYFGVDRLIEGPAQPGADLEGADLTAADLTGANLSHANLAGVKLTAANLTDVFYDEKTTWPEGLQQTPGAPDRNRQRRTAAAVSERDFTPTPDLGHGV
jgi:hypothetical protein